MSYAWHRRGKSLWHSSLCHTRPTTWHHSTTSGTIAGVTSWVTTCGHAWPSRPRTRNTLRQGCQIGRRTTSFDRSYTTAKKSNWIRHSFLKLSMQNRSLPWKIVLYPMINGPSYHCNDMMHRRIPVCIDASYHCNFTMVSNGHKICTMATCYYVVGCDFSLSFCDKWWFYN